MTTMIESTSSALPLRERAIAAADEREAKYAADEAERERKECERKLNVLRIQLRDKLGIVDGVTVSERRSRHDGYVIDDGAFVEWVATVDGVNFTLRERSGDYRAGLEKLHVQVPCERGCGKDLWKPVDSLEELGRALATDEHIHKFACLQQFDDEGEPTTDRDGNPLPPRGPFSDPPTSSSPWQRANDGIDSIEAAARNLAEALNGVSSLEDERALVKAGAIKRLVESGAYSSATAAEKVVELDELYAAHRGRQREAEYARHAAIAAYDAAVLRARLAVESFVVEERNR